MEEIDGRQLQKKDYAGFVRDFANGAKFQHLRAKYNLDTMGVTKALFFLPYIRGWVENTTMCSPIIFFGSNYLQNKRTKELELNELKNSLECAWERKRADVT